MFSYFILVQDLSLCFKNYLSMLLNLACLLAFEKFDPVGLTLI